MTTEAPVRNRSARAGAPPSVTLEASRIARETAAVAGRLLPDLRGLALRFGLAVAAPAGRVIRIGPDNKSQGRTSIVTAAARGWSFAVEVDRDILAIDVDDPSLQPALEVLSSEMEESGVRRVIVASGRPGHRHVFARIEDSGLFEELGAKAKALDLPPRRDIRSPLAPHRAGLSPELISPRDPRSALEGLAPSRTRPDLSPRIAELLRWGDREGRYPSRSEADAAIALGALNVGWIYEEFRAAMLDEINRGGARAQEEGREGGAWAAEHYLGLTWEAALRHYHMNPAPTPGAIVAALRPIRAAAEATPWRGRRGVTDFAVLRAVISISEQAFGLEFTASHRQIAEAAGRDRKTVARAIERLSGGRNWLMKLEAGAGETATRWRLQIPEGREDTPLSLTPPLEESIGSKRRLSPGHDAFRHGALNASGFQIYDTLHPETPQTRSQLAEKTGRHPSTISAALKSLKEHGLAEKRGIGWVRLETDLNEVARDLGSAGTGDRQRERHTRERDGYREYREWTASRKLRASASA